MIVKSSKLERSVRSDKNKGVRKGSNYTVSFLAQVRACARRQLLIKLGQREDQYVKLFTIVSISLMISSLFFNESNDTNGAYSRGGIMLFAGLFTGWLQLSQGVDGYSVISLPVLPFFYHHVLYGEPQTRCWSIFHLLPLHVPLGVQPHGTLSLIVGSQPHFQRSYSVFGPQSELPPHHLYERTF
jgi:hypothetical protein